MKIENEKEQTQISYYLGTWRNSYDKARLIGEMNIIQGKDGLQIAIKNSQDSFYTGPWEIATLKPHSYAPEINDIVAFQTRIDLDDIEAVLAINENKGLLIIAGYITFKNDNSKTDCFVREFFYKV